MSNKQVTRPGHWGFTTSLSLARWIYTQHVSAIEYDAEAAVDEYGDYAATNECLRLVSKSGGTRLVTPECFELPVPDATGRQMDPELIIGANGGGLITMRMDMQNYLHGLLEFEKQNKSELAEYRRLKEKYGDLE